MESATRWPQLKLFFNEGVYHELIATEFQLNQSAKILKTTRRSGQTGSFTWSRGVPALTIFLVEYIRWSKEFTPEDFEMRGERKSPAASLDMTLGKGKSKDQIAIQWQVSMFGQPEKAASSYLNTYIDRTNPDKKRSCEPFGLKVRVSLFPPECVRIFMGERELKEIGGLEELSVKLCKAWKGIQNLRLRRPTASDDSHIGSDQKSPLDPKHIETPTPNVALTGKLLVDSFKMLPLASIKSHIIAALSLEQGRDAVKKSLAEILSPDCINVMAEKVVREPIDVFIDFYGTDYGSPQKIKRSMAKVIAENPVLRRELATKLTHSTHGFMYRWTQEFSRLFPSKMAKEVKRALSLARRRASIVRVNNQIATGPSITFTEG